MGFLDRIGQTGKAALICFVLVFQTGCRTEVSGPLDVNLGKQSGGEIVGKVFWDPDGDGSFGAAYNAGVSFSLISAIGSCNGATGPCTTTTTGGTFSFHNISEGSHTLYAYKMNPGKGAHSCRIGVTVLKQQVTNVGTLRMKPLSAGSPAGCS